MRNQAHPSRSLLASREAELLLLCASTRLAPYKVQRIRQILAGSVDWKYLVQQALYHGTVPLLFRNLSLNCSHEIPETIFSRLKDSAAAITRRNLHLSAELAKLVNLFSERGIRAIPFKGPVVAAVAYGNLSLRQFTDLDILMPREDMPNARELLILEGYEPKLALGAREEAAYLASHHDYKFIRAKDGIVVEIQWGVTERLFAFQLNFDDIWKRRETVNLAGGNVFSLCPEDLLLVLCVHGAKHRWAQLKWISDLAEVVQTCRQKLNWDRVRDQGRRAGGERMLLLGLSLAHEFLSVELPRGILKGIELDPEIRYLAAKVGHRLFREGTEPGALRDEPPFFYWHVRERLWDKFVILRKYFPEYFVRMLVPNHRDHAFLAMPPFLSVSYYAVRPVRLFWEYCSTVLHRLYRGAE